MIHFVFVAAADLDTLEYIIHCKRIHLNGLDIRLSCMCFSAPKSIVVFGELNNFNSVNITFFVNPMNNIGINYICLSYGCETCTSPILASYSTTILSADRLYSVAKGTFAASAVFVDSLTQSRDYTLALMLHPQAYRAVVYYAASIDFVGAYLQALHSNDDFYIKVIALASNTEIRIALNQDAYINESYYTFHREELVYTLDIGETVMISSKNDLTGTRVTANNIISLYSGHYCASGKATNCSILNEQIPPYNSWGNTFVLRTNIISLRGNMFKIVASDVGANVLMNCTTDGTNYEANNFNLGFRQHTVLSVSHNYCTVKSDENILIIQFRDSSPPLKDTFMTIIPSLVHYENSYVFNTHEGFISNIAITVKDTNVITNSLLLNGSPITISWQMIELDGDTYNFGTLFLSGIYTLAFLGKSVEFGVILYGTNENDTYAYPTGMKLNLKEITYYGGL